MGDMGVFGVQRRSGRVERFWGAGKFGDRGRAGDEMLWGVQRRCGGMRSFGVRGRYRVQGRFWGYRGLGWGL